MSELKPLLCHSAFLCSVVPVKRTGPALKAMLFQLTLEKTRASRDKYTEAVCCIDVIAGITLNP